MLKKLLSKIFGYSKNRKTDTRELLKESKSDKTDNKKNKKKEKFMENENTVNNEIEKNKADTKPTSENNEEASKNVETETKPVENGKNTNVPTQENGGADKQDENTQASEPTDKVKVEDTEPTGNGVRLDDLVTKEELAERFAALEAKFDAVVKENQDLKDKYENKDFGNYSRQGNIPADKQAEDSFDSYSKSFM